MWNHNVGQSKKVVEDYFFGDPISIADRILFVKRETRLAEYKEHLTDVKEFGYVWRGLTGTLQSEKVTVMATGIGPNLVGDVVYALNRPGAICLYSGTCGGLHEGLEIGDYFLADQAVCGDGYTLHLGHSPLSLVSGDMGLLRSLKHLLASKAYRVDNGITFTTSSVVREVDDDFWIVVDKRCRIIEMAAAPFYAAAKATGKRAAAYFWVTDLPTRGKSFFEPLASADIRIKQERYNRTVSLDLELLSCL